jgi:DNA polymerase zeta
VLHERVPAPPFAALSAWFEGGVGAWLTLRHYADRAVANLRLIHALDLVGRTSEMARLLGIDFFSVLTRGSQFRVEAVALRVAKPLNYLMPTASRVQVARQAAMECTPLVMEPVSRLYTSPVVVLDFQSLYPSIIIAYNMCYASCLGRLSLSAPPRLLERLGFMPYAPPPGALGRLGARAFVAPNGAVFAPPEDRPGVLPRMLREILATRVMVKNAMKTAPVAADAVMTRVMHARQFALKMIANVTYGYTAVRAGGRVCVCVCVRACVRSCARRCGSSCRVLFVSL